LDNLVGAGLLKKEAPDQTEFDGLLDAGRKKLADAQKQGISTESRFDLAYNAAHALSLAAMRWHGYRPNKQRFVVFQALQHTVGLKPEEWRILDKAHSSRNSAEYEGYFDVDEQLLSEVIRISTLVHRRVRELGAVQGKK
jgi:hypothetical protein